MSDNHILASLLNALLDIYSIGNTLAPFTRVNKVMLDEGVSYSTYLHLYKLHDELATPDNMVSRDPSFGYIYSDLWVTDNRYINGSVKILGKMINIKDFDLQVFDHLKEDELIEDPSMYLDNIEIEDALSTPDT